MAETKPPKLPRLPQWLPRIVKDHALDLISKGGLNTVEPLMLRLVSDPKMEKVWKAISTVENKEKLVEFVEYVRLHPTLQGNPDELIETPSVRKQRATFNKVADHSQEVIKHLSKLTKSKSSDEAWGLLEASLKRSELFEAGNPSKDRFMELREIQTRLKYIQTHISVTMLIDTIGMAAKIAAEAPDDPYPVRRHTKYGKSNRLILDLTSFFVHTLYIQPTHSIIAAIVNTTFQFPEGGISPDNVRKLVKSSKQGS